MTCTYRENEPRPGLCAGPNARAEALREYGTIYNSGCKLGQYRTEHDICANCIMHAECGDMFWCSNGECVIGSSMPTFGDRCLVTQDCAPLSCVEGKCAECIDGEVRAEYFCYSGAWREMPEYSFMSGREVVPLLSATAVGVLSCELVYFLALVWLLISCTLKCRAASRPVSLQSRMPSRQMTPSEF